MTKSQIKKLANQLLVTVNYNLSINCLISYIENQGWQVFEYNGNNADGDILLKIIGCQEYAKRKDSFYYATNQDEEDQYIFVRQNENVEILAKRLLHEIGHIQLGHNNKQACTDLNATQEDEANLFVWLVTNGNTTANIKTKRLIKMAAITTTVIIFVFLAGVFYGQNYVVRYYITSTGNKYHQEFCQFIKKNNCIAPVTKAQAKKGRYAPCKVCLPE